MIPLEISGAGLGLKMRPRLGSIYKLSPQHASFQPNSIDEKRKTEKQMGESEMKHREISRCHRTDVYLLYLTLVTRGHNCGQAARVYLAHFVMAKSIFFLFCYTLILSLMFDLQYQPSAHLINQSSSLATVFGHHTQENHRFETTTDRRNPREIESQSQRIPDLLEKGSLISAV